MGSTIFPASWAFLVGNIRCPNMRAEKNVSSRSYTNHNFFDTLPIIRPSEDSLPPLMMAPSHPVRCVRPSLHVIINVVQSAVSDG
jgi:hypothetical protein